MQTLGSHLKVLGGTAAKDQAWATLEALNNQQRSEGNHSLQQSIHNWQAFKTCKIAEAAQTLRLANQVINI